MKLIVITSEKDIRNEAQVLNSLFDEGLCALHLRKPLASKENVADLLADIKAQYHSKIVLHDCFELAKTFKVQGLHLNKRNSEFFDDVKLPLSKSCHSLIELKDIAEFSYVFLSPIFNSISKAGYLANFSHEDLLNAKNEGVINERVVALGGIDVSNLERLAEYGFGGAAVLGTLWSDYETSGDAIALMKRFNELMERCSAL